MADVLWLEAQNPKNKKKKLPTKAKGEKEFPTNKQQKEEASYEDNKQKKLPTKGNTEKKLPTKTTQKRSSLRRDKK